MKTLKTLGIVLLILVAIPLVVAIFVSRVNEYEKTISINAPIDSVWENVNSLSDLDKWSPWFTSDSNIKEAMTGQDGTVGAEQSWKSKDKDVGRGSQKITRIEKPFVFETDLKFTKPYRSNSKAYILLVTEGDATKVTWGLRSVMRYPFNIMNLYKKIDETMDKDWDNGLSKLKALCENKPQMLNTK